MTIEEVRPGYCRVRMPLHKEITNGLGYAHGGAIFSLADIAFGAAANDGSEHFVVSLSTSIEFLKPGLVGPIVAEAKVVRSGRHVQNYDVKIYDGNNELIARTIAQGYTTAIQCNEVSSV